MKRLLIFWFLTILISSCNLTAVSNTGDASDTPGPTRTLPLATDNDAAGTTSVPNGTTPPAIFTPIASSTQATVGACTPQSDWPEYTVQPGDNLTKIAQRTRSTVDELIEANCVDNPNRIRVGDTIYVPNEP